VLPALRLPAWVRAWVARRSRAPLRSDAARMDLAISLAAENVRRRTGGPFGAVVLERRTGRVVAVGVNRVESTGLSFAHAEMLALSLAHHAHGHHDLAARGPALELVTSSEPCAMCFGAIPWSGITRLVCGARASDAEEIGFDEGAKPRDWVRALEQRGVEVLRDVRRKEAVAVLRAYADAGATIY